MPAVIDKPEILDWRESQFKALGFAEHSKIMATRGDIDLNDVRRLMSKGCSVELALRIVL